MGRSLVLNASYQPLCVVPIRRALILALKGKAEVLHTNGQTFRSERLEMRAPSVVRLNYFVKVPYRARSSLSRRAVFVRDNFECQYCGGPAENVDHIIPKSRGGGHTWDNVVAACRTCNSRKENPQEVRAPVSFADRLVAGRTATVLHRSGLAVSRQRCRGGHWERSLFRNTQLEYGLRPLK